MARKKKKKGGGGGDPAWLITFTDMMTLMLTFFVLLVSMAVFDERRKLVVLGSIIGTFGMGEQGFDMRSVKDTKATVEPGPMQDVADLEPLKNLMFDEYFKDLNFMSNKFVQILSISDRVLFEPGTTRLSVEGRRLLDRFLPFLLKIDFPLLLAGHSSSLRDEFIDDYRVDFDQEEEDPSWRISMGRVLALYRHLLDRGMDPEKLRVEAFGRFHPRYNENTPEGRSGNRRVDIVLDKRNAQWIERLELAKESRPKRSERFNFRDFFFDVTGAGNQRAE